MMHHLKKTDSMSASDIQVLFDIPMQLGECPLWHPLEEALYWIDIAGHAVHRFRPSTREHRTWHIPSEPGCIAWSAGGGLIVAMRSGLAMLDTESDALVDLAKAPYDTKRVRFNDGRCDAAGRLWVGTLYDPRDRQLGSLFCVEQSRIRDVGLPVTVSNGVAFSTDSGTLYHSDTTAHRINSYDYDVATGHVSNGRLFMQFSADKTHNYGGRPDGAAIDSENAYWCAMYEGGKILRISPDGEILREIQLPVRCPTMVAFGDSDFRTLYVTTAKRNRPDEEIRQLPLSGCVLRLRVDVPGCAEPPFRP